MALIVTPRFSGQTSISKSDVETLFAQILKQVGGDYYSNGVLVPNPQGNLDISNFRPGTAFDNNAKAEPYSLVPIKFVIYRAAMGSTYYASTKLPYAMTPVEWSVTWMKGDGAGTYPTINLQADLYVNGVQVSSTGAITNSSPESPIGNTAIPSGGFVLQAPAAGDVLHVKLSGLAANVGAPTYVQDVTFTIWCKAKHVA